MKTAILILCAVPGLVQAADFSDYENLLKESIGIRAELADVLEGVADKASAKAALPRVREIVGQYVEVAAKILGVPQPDEAGKMAIERGLKDEFAPIRTKLAANILRLATANFYEVDELRQALDPVAAIAPAPPQLQGPHTP